MWFKFNFQDCHFHFLVHQFLSIIYSCKMSYGLSLDNKQTTQVQALPSKCRRNNRLHTPITNRLWAWCNWSLIVMCICYYTGKCGLKNYLQRIYASCNYWALIYHSNWNLESLLGNWYFYLNCGIWKFCISEQCKAKLCIKAKPRVSSHCLTTLE